MIKIFVGCDPNNTDLEQMMIFEYSLQKHTTSEYEIEWMQLSRNPNSFWYSDGNKGWQTQTWSTPFSGFRWSIPARCNFEGKALYFDADFMFFSDINDLWSQEFDEGCAVMAKGGSHGWRYCSAFWNCEEARRHLLPITKLRSLPNAHQRMMAHFSQNQHIVQPFNGDWNNLDGEGKSVDKIDALHYTDMRSQFSHKYSIPRLAKEGSKHWFDGTVMTHTRKDLQQVFDDLYQEALDNGWSLDDYRVEPYGDFKKQSQAGYISGHNWST